MAGLHFDSTFNSEPVMKALGKIQKGIYETAKIAELSSGRIDAAFNRISLKGLERIHELMQGFPKEVQGLESFKKQMGDLEKRLEQANKKIVELQNQVKQPIAIQTNTNEVTKETFAYDSLLESLNDILGARGQNVAAILQEQNAIRINQKELKILQELESKGLKLSDAQQTRRIQLTNSIMQHKQAVSSLQQVVSNEIKLEESARGSMDEMSQSLGRMRMAYRQLTEQERNSKFGQDLLKNIQVADAQIKQLDATIGNHQREVGNYKQKWDGLGMSIQQIGREFPSLAYGPKVFFSAISNNLPILADELKRARNEFNALKAEGKAATPVWKQVASSLFSWNTALTVGITLLTLYGDKLVDWVSGLFDAKDAVKNLVSVEQEMALARKSGMQSSVKERTELDLLYSKLKDITLSTKERSAAVSEWIKKYPQHVNIMNGELVSLGKLESAYLSLSKQIVEAAKARAYADKITELETKKDETLTKRQNQYVTYLKAIEERNKAEDEYKQKEKNGFGTATAKIAAKDKIFRAEQNVIDQKNAWEDLIKETKAYDDAISIISKKIKVDDLFPQPNEGTYDFWQQQAQIADSSLKQIKDSYLKVLKSGNKEKIKVIPEDVTKQYNDAIKLKSEAEKALKVYDSSSAGTLRKEQEKRNEELLTLQRNNQKSEIDLMEEGSKKKIAQIELDYKNEIAAIKKKEEEWSKAQGGKLTEKQSQEISIAYTQAEDKKDKSISDVMKETQKEESERLKAAQSAWNEYYQTYGTWEQKRLALTKEYQQKIKEVQNDKNKSGDEKNALIATLQKEWDEALANLDLSKLKEDINWGMIFGDMSKVTKKQLQQVKKQLQEFKRSPEFKTSTPEQIKVIEEALNNINTALVDKGGFFGGLTDSLTEYEGTVYKVKEAQEELEKALKSGDEVAIEKAKKKKNAAEQNQANAQANVEKSKDKAISNITAVSNAIVQLGKENVSLSDIGNTVGTLVDALSSSGTKIGGIISAILSIIDAAGEVGTFQYGMDIIENISSTVTDAFARDTESITGLDMSFMKSADYDDYNELVEQYDTLIDVWDQLLDKKKAYIKESYGIEATKAGQEALDLLNSERKITRELASSRLDAGASSGSHSMNYRMWKGSYDYNGTNWKDVAGDISKSLGGVDFSSMWSMLDMSSEQLEWIKINYSGLWASMDGDFRGYLDDIIQYGDTEKEILKSINEQLTQTSFDSLFDSFLNTLMDMDASSKDFADSFEEYMRKAIFTSMFAKNYEDELTKWYEAFAEANKKEEGITEDDVKNLRNRWDNIVNGALSDREAWEKIVGSSGSESSREASKKGVATASQDSVDELNGRFTVIQGHTYEINSSVKVIQSDTAKIAEKLSFLTSMDKNMSDMVRGHDIIVAHLSNIEGYTANLVDIRQFMYFMKLGIDSLNTKGITLKR